MAGKVFFSVTMSLDGFIAPEERMDDPDVQRWMAQWMELQQWIFPQRFSSPAHRAPQRIDVDVDHRRLTL